MREHHQTCLAHLARDIAHGVEASTDMQPVRLKVWMEKVFHLAHNLKSTMPSTIKTKQRQLDKVLSDILATLPECKIAETLRTKMARARPRLLTFLDYPGEVEITNNACERALRPAVIQRKSANGFRSFWAARGDCAVRTVVDTRKLQGHSPFDTIITTLT